jgi:hypothetical protein
MRHDVAYDHSFKNLNLNHLTIAKNSVMQQTNIYSLILVYLHNNKRVLG